MNLIFPEIPPIRRFLSVLELRTRRRKPLLMLEEISFLLLFWQVFQRETTLQWISLQKKVLWSLFLLTVFTTFCIYHFLYLPSSMLEEISSSWYFNKKFIVQWIHNRFSGKEMTLVTFFLLKWSFLEIPLILRFLFDSIALNENAEFAEMFRFSINSRDFCQT